MVRLKKSVQILERLSLNPKLEGLVTVGAIDVMKNEIPELFEGSLEVARTNAGEDQLVLFYRRHLKHLTRTTPLHDRTEHDLHTFLQMNIPYDRIN